MGESERHLRLITNKPSDDAGVQLCLRDDDSLLLLARGGVAAAFDEIVRRYQTRVLRIAARYTGQPALARDIAQSTFVAIHRALPRYRPSARFASYLYRVLLNECRMAQRSYRHAERAHARLAEFTGAPACETPEAQLLARERRREVERAVARLGERPRVVVALRFGGEMSYQEIAGALGIPLGTVKRRLFDALVKLRELMNQADEL